MDTTTFYATTSGLCFTLLGFWWVVVQFRHAELTRHGGARAFAFLVSLQFVIPGLVSLASLIAPGALWRVAFGLAGVLGVLAVLAGVGLRGQRHGVLHRLGRWAWLALPLYLLVAVVAVVPDVVRASLGVEPLQVEGLLLLVILFVGIMLAWLLFTEPPIESDPPGVA